MDQKEIDLHPREWRTDRERPREPFFGSGAPEAAAYAVGFAIMATLVYLFR